MKRALLIIAAFAGAVLSTTAYSTGGIPDNMRGTIYVIDHSATNWTSSNGLGFGDEASGGGGGDGSPTWLDKVTVTGKRIINVEVVQVSSFTFTGVNNQFDPTPLAEYHFDSRDQGVSMDPKQAPSPEDHQKCVTNCANVQTAENSLCDSRAASISETTIAGAAGAKFGRYIPILGKYIPKDADKVIYETGTKAAIQYALICKGYAAGRYYNCVNGTCQA